MTIRRQLSHLFAFASVACLLVLCWGANTGDVQYWPGPIAPVLTIAVLVLPIAAAIAGLKKYLLLLLLPIGLVAYALLHMFDHYQLKF